MKYIHKAPALVRLGYRVVPIPPGARHPRGIDEWQLKRYSVEECAAWEHERPLDGIAILPGVTGVTGLMAGALDLDVYCERTSALLYDLLTAKYGLTLSRVGLYPKRLFPFRMPVAQRKMLSAEYTILHGGIPKGQRLEIMGEGSSFIAYHTHVDTGKPYTWYDGELAETPVSGLPVLDKDQCVEIINLFEKVMDSRFERRHSHTNQYRTALDPDDPLSWYSPTLGLTEDQMWDYLDKLPVSYLQQYDTWVRVGMAIHHETGGSEDGLDLWDDISVKAGSDYDGRSPLEYHWIRFGRNTMQAKPVTFKYIIKAVKQSILTKGGSTEGVTGMAIVDEMARRYVLVGEGPGVYDLHAPANEPLKSIPEFTAMHANIRIPIDKPLANGNLKTDMVPASKLWLTSDTRQTAVGTTYIPGGGRLIMAEDGRLWANQCHLPEFEQTDREDLLGVFHDHMAYLVPDPAECRIFIQKMAWCVQHPGERDKTTILHVAEPHGTGRGWVIEQLQRLVGTHNVTRPKVKDIADGVFQNYLHRSLIVVVDEIREGSADWGLHERMRDLLTEKDLQVNVKYGDVSTQQVYAKFFMFSNHIDALPIPPGDRRIIVLAGPEFAQPTAYYTTLYRQAEKPGFIEQLYWYLRRMDLDDYPWQVAPMTPAKRRMMDATKSDGDLLVDGFLADHGPLWAALTKRQLLDAVLRFGAVDPFESELTTAKLSAILRNRGITQVRIRLDNGARPTALVLDRAATPEVQAASVAKYQSAYNVL